MKKNVILSIGEKRDKQKYVIEVPLECVLPEELFFLSETWVLGIEDVISCENCLYFLNRCKNKREYLKFVSVE